MHSSSHLSPADTNDPKTSFRLATKLRLAHIPRVDVVKSYRGLNLIEPMDEYRSNQFDRFKTGIIEDTNETMLLVGLSNDWEKLFYRNNKLLRILPSAKKRWLQLQRQERACWNAHKFLLVKDSSSRYLTAHLRNYAETLKDIFRQTGMTKVYHSSVLERQYMKCDRTHLEILFAALNSYLHDILKDLDVTNKNGIPVEFKFINVAWQYYSAENFDCFRHSEIHRVQREKWHRQKFNRVRDSEAGLAHRSLSSLTQLLDFYYSKLV